MAIGGITILTLPFQMAPKHSLVIDDEGNIQLIKKTWYVLWGDTQFLGEVRQVSQGSFQIMRPGKLHWEPWLGTQLVECDAGGYKPEPP